MSTINFGLTVNYENNQIHVSWATEWIPIGTIARLLVTDEHGASKSGLTINYAESNASAVICGMGREDGTRLRVSIRAETPSSPDQIITIYNLATPHPPSLANRNGGILASWTDTEPSCSYEVEVLDADGNPLSVQPGIKVSQSQALIDRTALVYGSSYQVRVRCSKANSYSAWSGAARIKLETEIPDNPLLRALYDRLLTAGRSFSLGPEVILEPSITRLFRRLLGMHDSALPLTNATVNCSVESVTLSATTTLFGRERVVTSFVFTASGRSLSLRLDAPLGTMSVSQMCTYGILPRGSYAPESWAASLADFPTIQMSLNSADATVRFSGEAAQSAWPVLNLAHTVLGSILPAITITAPLEPEPLRYMPRFATQLILDGARIPVYLQIPAGLNGWQIGLDAQGGFNLNDLSTLNALMGGAESNLPNGVISLKQFWITALDISFPPTGGQKWRFNLGLCVGNPSEDAGTPVWIVRDGVLAVDRITAQLSWILFTRPNQIIPVSDISGTMVGRILIAGHLVEATITVPVGPDGWRLESAASIDLERLSDLGAYFGSDTNYLGAAFKFLGTIETIALTAFRTRFHPPPNATLDEVGFQLTVRKWVIPALPWFLADEVIFDLNVLNPAIASRDLTANLVARLTLSERLRLEVIGRYESVNGLLLMSCSGSYSSEMPLSELSALVSPKEAADNVPDSLPMGGSFVLHGLSFVYDTRAAYLPELTLQLESQAAWTIIPDLLVLSGFRIDLNLSVAAAGKPRIVTGAILAPMMLAGATFELAARKAKRADPWVLSGSLADVIEIDFATVLSQLLGSQVRLPTDYGFPKALSVISADVTLTPSTKSFRFSGATFVDWAIAFGQTTLAVTELTGEVDFPGDDRLRSGFLQGTFRFGSMRGTAVIALGSGATPLVVKADITNAQSISPSSQVNALCGTGAFDTAPCPHDFPTPAFISAGVVLDLSVGSYLVHGQYGNAEGDELFGALALHVITKGEPGKQGYTFIAALKNWSFSAISKSLAIVDQILCVEQVDAVVALASFDNPVCTDIATYIPQVTSDVSIKKGLNFFARLTFGRGLMTHIATLLDVKAKGPIIVKGFIPANADSSQFTARLGDLTLLGAVAFDQLVMTYEVKKGRTLTLTGVIHLSIPLLSGEKTVSFHGGMEVDEVKALFSVRQTDQSLVDPLGIPGVTLSGLGLEFDYHFATQQKAASWSMEVCGSTTIGSAALTGRVLLQNGIPVASIVGITKPLSIDAIFQQLIGTSWPDGLLAITFQTGKIWYAPRAIALANETLDQGFNATTTVDVYALTGLKLTVRMAQKVGIVAVGHYPRAIDWGFLALYQDASNPTLGPLAELDSGNKQFTVKGGLRLFDTSILDLVLRVTSKAMAGRLSIPHSIGPFDRPAFDFTWDSRSFQVDNWPLHGLKLPDFSFKNIPGSGKCGGVVIAALPIKSKFNLKPTLSITTSPTPSLRVVIDGSFDLECSSAAYSGTILTANIVKATIDVALPGTGHFTWENLGHAFAKCIQDAAQSIFDNLLKDPVNLAKLLAVPGIEFAATQLIDYLVCRGAPRASAEKFVEGATSAVPVAVTILGVSVSVGGVLGSWVGGVFVALAMWAGGSKNSPRPASPGAPSLSWRDGQLAVSWESVADADHYSVIHKTEGAWVSSDAISTTSTTLTIAAGSLYTVAVVAYGVGGVSNPGPASTFQAIGAPTGLESRYADSCLTTAWNAVPGADPNGYRVSIVRDGQPLLPAPQLTFPTATRCLINDERLQSGGSYTVAVTASSAVMTGPPASTKVAISTLPPPSGLALSSVAETVRARWKPVEGATGYRLCVFDSQDSPLSPQPTAVIDAATCSAILSGGALSNGKNIKVKVAASAPGKGGSWSAPESWHLRWLPSPAGFGLVYGLDKAQMTVTFEPVIGATGPYQLQVLDATGKPLSPDFLVSVPTPSTMIDAGRLTTASNYQVRLRAMAENAYGVWTEPLPLDLVMLVHPKAVTVFNEPDGLSVYVDPVAGANAYEVEVLDATGKPLVPPLIAEGVEQPLFVPGDRLSIGQTYQVRARALSVRRTSNITAG